MDAVTLRNRLAVATSIWRDTIREPLPRMQPGKPADQVEQFEIALVERMMDGATPETAREVADRTWDLVRDRPDADPVKARVTELHEELARRVHLGD